MPMRPDDEQQWRDLVRNMGDVVFEGDTCLLNWAKDETRAVHLGPTLLIVLQPGEVLKLSKYVPPIARPYTLDERAARVAQAEHVLGPLTADPEDANRVVTEDDGDPS